MGPPGLKLVVRWKRKALLAACLLVVALPARARELDPDAPPEATHEIAPFLKVGSRLAVDAATFLRSDLHGSQRWVVEPSLSLATWYAPPGRIRAFLDIEPAGFADVGRGSGHETRGRLELTEAFVILRQILGPQLYVKAGRQRFEDDREWLYDEELDAVRAEYVLPEVAFEVSASRRDLVRRDLVHDTPRDPSTNLHARVETLLSPSLEIAAFALYRHHRSRSGERPLFLGVQAAPRGDDPLRYWLEFAHVRGTHGAEDISGYGFDVGTSYRMDLRLSPTATVAFAFGTGDGNRADHADHAFRQTGLQDNEVPIGGIVPVRYYGEMFDPELSNLIIPSVGLGVRPTGTTSVDLLFHRYWQEVASSSIRESQLREKPTGRSRDLGSEVDLVAGIDQIFDVGLKSAFGMFVPGRAFARSRAGFVMRAKVRYDFW